MMTAVNRASCMRAHEDEEAVRRSLAWAQAAQMADPNFQSRLSKEPATKDSRNSFRFTRIFRGSTMSGLNDDEPLTVDGWRTLIGAWVYSQTRRI